MSQNFVQINQLFYVLNSIHRHPHNFKVVCRTDAYKILPRVFDNLIIKYEYH